MSITRSVHRWRHQIVLFPLKLKGFIWWRHSSRTMNITSLHILECFINFILILLAFAATIDSRGIVPVWCVQRATARCFRQRLRVQCDERRGVPQRSGHQVATARSRTLCLPVRPRANLNWERIFKVPFDFCFLQGIPRPNQLHVQRKRNADL